MTIENDLCQKHLTEPESGDYWHEMFTPICVVIEVLNNTVILCNSRKSVDRDHWTWDLDKLTAMSKSEFARWLSYKTIPEKTWAKVAPTQHLWAVKEVRGI